MTRLPIHKTWSQRTKSGPKQLISYFENKWTQVLKINEKCIKYFQYVCLNSKVALFYPFVSTVIYINSFWRDNDKQIYLKKYFFVWKIWIRPDSINMLDPDPND